jgi:hypothetical protein
VEKSASEVQVDYMARLKHALALLAVRWNAELVAEKSCIVLAALVAMLYFDDLVESNTLEIAFIGLIFFVVEMATDVIFVYTMDTHQQVPLLTAVPHEPVLSYENVSTSIMMACTFNALSVCIGMAANVDLGSGTETEA